MAKSENIISISCSSFGMKSALCFLGNAVKINTTRECLVSSNFLEDSGLSRELLGKAMSPYVGKVDDSVSYGPDFFHWLF